MRTIFNNAKVITPFRLIRNGGVIVCNEKIIGLFEGPFKATVNGDTIIDLKGKYLSPGFIDIHAHGGGNHDFMDGTVEAIVEGCRAHMAHGTTSIIPTISTCPINEVFDFLDNFKNAKSSFTNMPNLPGLHLEGPYLSIEQIGAQNPKYIKNPDRSEYMGILDYSGNIIRWTIAPELDGALDMGVELRNRGILACIGHSAAVYEQVLKAYEHGFTHVTHLYSGTSMVKRINACRYSGVVESAYLIDEITVEIIADGKHLPESLLKLVYKIKGSNNICLVTDSMRAAGTTQGGESIIGGLKSGQKVIVKDGAARLPDGSAFAGSTATADRLVKTMIKAAGIPLTEAVKMMTHTPARVIGINKSKGSLAAGMDADIIVFNDNIDVDLVMVKGNIQLDKIKQIKKQ
jgi:N-acetylglucosamine-6-phosphate deacetylase